MHSKHYPLSRPVLIPLLHLQLFVSFHSWYLCQVLWPPEAQVHVCTLSHSRAMIQWLT